MAIYAGNWKDGDGVAFDGGALARGQFGAGTAQVRRPGRWGHGPRAHNAAVSRYLAYLWAHVLSEEQRFQWSHALPGLGATRDPDQVMGRTTPFLSFAVQNWMRVWRGGDVQSYWPQLPGFTIPDFYLDECTEHTFTYSYTLPDDPAKYKWLELVILHINPKRINSTKKYLFTRNVEDLDQWAFSPGWKQWTLDLGWHQYVGQEAWFLFRERNAYHYWQTFYQHITVV